MVDINFTLMDFAEADRGRERERDFSFFHMQELGDSFHTFQWSHF